MFILNKEWNKLNRNYRNCVIKNLGVERKKTTARDKNDPKMMKKKREQLILLYENHIYTTVQMFEVTPGKF